MLNSKFGRILGEVLEDMSNRSDPNKKDICSKVKDKLKKSGKGNRTAAIEQWIKIHQEHFQGLSDEQSGFICDALCDETCWSGTELKPDRCINVLDKLDILDPLVLYQIACFECAKGEIKRIFEKILEDFNVFINLQSDENKLKQMFLENPKNSRNILLLFLWENRHMHDDLLFTFWINEKTGDLRENIDPEDGFDKAVYNIWSKGLEYFYNLICSEKKLGKEERDKLLVNAFATLSPGVNNDESTYKCAAALNYVINIIISSEVDDKLLLAIPPVYERNKALSAVKNFNNGVFHRSLSCLVEHGFFGTTTNVIQYLNERCSKSEAKEMLKPAGYIDLLSALSSYLDPKNYDSDSKNKARSVINSFYGTVFSQIIMKISNPSEEKITFDTFKNAISNLIVDQENRENAASTLNAGDTENLDLVSSILRFAKDCCSDKCFKLLKKKIAIKLDKKRYFEMVDTTSSCDLIEELCGKAAL